MRSQSQSGLPDYLVPDLRILFVGINPGIRSATLGHHYAGRSNRFWNLLYEAALVPERLSYRDDSRLPEWGMGLTNLVPRATVGVEELTAVDYAAGRLTLLRKIRRYRPRMVALLGMTLYPILFPLEARRPQARTSIRDPLQIGGRASSKSQREKCLLFVSGDAERLPQTELLAGTCRKVNGSRYS